MQIQLIIDICGWLYFIIWSVSFYGQLITLLKQKSAMGMSSNYILINLTGYAMYTVYNVYGYMKGQNAETGNVDNSDILFSLHSVLVYSATVALFFYYPHKLEISIWTKIYLVIQWSVLIYFGIYSFQAKKSIRLSFFGFKTPLKFIQTLGYFKMFSTLLKHPPQIYHNFKRKSTKGWSIEGMVMDFFGGLFSLIAVLLELYINPKYHVNIAKLFLAIVSMFYDVTYMIQHFVLYKNNEPLTSSKLIQSTKQRLSPRIQNIKQVQADEEKQKMLNKKPAKK